MTDTDQPEGDTSPSMLKEETIKEDGRTLIYYTFPVAEIAPNAEEAAHV